MSSQKLFCNYSDTDYQSFWTQMDRRYEDLIERETLKQLLPEFSQVLIELGAGFGRLLKEYQGRAKNVILIDYAQNLLNQARLQKITADIEVSYLNADIYHLPFNNNSIDTAVMIRVSHHLEEPEKVFSEVYRVLKPGGIFIFEYANKRDALEILRFILKLTKESPFNKKRIRYGKSLFFNYHPQDIENRLEKSGFKILKIRSVSNFRHKIFKKIFYFKILVFFDKLLSKVLAPFRFGPSIFIKAQKPIK